MVPRMCADGLGPLGNQRPLLSLVGSEPLFPLLQNSRPEVGRLQGLIGLQPRPSIYVLSMAAFKWQS